MPLGEFLKQEKERVEEAKRQREAQQIEFEQARKQLQEKADSLFIKAVTPSVTGIRKTFEESGCSIANDQFYASKYHPNKHLSLSVYFNEYKFQFDFVVEQEVQALSLKTYFFIPNSPSMARGAHPTPHFESRIKFEDLTTVAIEEIVQKHIHQSLKGTQ